MNIYIYIYTFESVWYVISKNKAIHGQLLTACGEPSRRASAGALQNARVLSAAGTAWPLRMGRPDFQWKTERKITILQGKSGKITIFEEN